MYFDLTTYVLYLLLTRKTTSHLIYQIFIKHFFCHSNHVVKSFCMRYAMTDYYRFVYAQYRNATINFKIETVEMFIFNFPVLYNIINGFCKF